mmetsp:Transcript_7091/g.15304  ORF Transcript_7091/g.15304 Transcript_7091/m.15304 type:complete len:451 (-) Transcript_7091:7-1359(-)
MQLRSTMTPTWSSSPNEIRSRQHLNSRRLKHIIFITLAFTLVLVALSFFDEVTEGRNSSFDLSKSYNFVDDARQLGIQEAPDSVNGHDHGDDFLFNPSASIEFIDDQDETRQLETHYKNSIQDPRFRILCTADTQSMAWGSYQARCVTLKNYADQCAPFAHVITRVLPEPGFCAHYNATLYVKGIPPQREELGRIFIDVVDKYDIKEEDIREGMEVIVQNKLQGDLYNKNHVTHIVEHWYNNDPEDTYIPEIRDLEKGSPLKVGNVCCGCPSPKIDSSNVEFTMIDEKVEGTPITAWFLKFMSSSGWTESQMTKLVETNEYGTGMLYYSVFRTLFDVMIVTPKRRFDKLTYGSIQRIVSVMKSGVPVLVEVRGPAFEMFVDRYGYSCVYAENPIGIKKYGTLEDALKKMHDANARKQCQEEGLKIAEDFSPSVMAKRLLVTLGYKGDFKC